ncbi:MAG: inositol monophosphatase [Nitrospirota bacterium]|nr:inositol monophosphatase [Nitrospirota bacterium]
MNDIADMRDVAVHAAKRAGALLRDSFGGRREISYKGEINLVTEMDRLSEKTIVSEISSAFPGHSIVAEEGANIENGSGYLWVIDPLDGTTNYAHGYPQFAVSIGLEYAGNIVLGIVYDPLREELFTAMRGNGAQLNGTTISVSRTSDLIRSLLATGFPYDRANCKENNLDYFNAMIMVSQEIRRNGSAALDLCNVAAGRLDGYWELKLRPWDVAAGSLIVREAGGTVSDLSGQRFSIRDELIIASNGFIHQQIIDALRRTGDSEPSTK